MIRPLLVLGLAVCCLSASHAAPDPAGSWGDWKGLIGDWVSDDGPGGTFSFAPELDGKVLVRRNQAELPAANGRPAVNHKDLLILYPEAGAVRGEYWDNEGHVIRYRGALAADKGVLSLTSEAAANAPTFRLSYVLEEKAKVMVRFAIAPPDHPDQFKTYVEGRCHRKAPS